MDSVLRLVDLNQGIDQQIMKIYINQWNKADDGWQ